MTFFLVRDPIKDLYPLMIGNTRRQQTPSVLCAMYVVESKRIKRSDSKMAPRS